MELWIRVQKNKQLNQGLVKVENLILEKYGATEWSIEQSCDTLAIYKTKERALEVLDEIQNILKPIIKIKYEYDDSQPIMNGEWLKSLKEENKIEELSTYVYEMPKE